MRRFNLRAMFDPRGRLTSLEFGDFGTAEGDKGPKREAPPRESCLIAWPTDPAMTGAAGIAAILGVQVSPCYRTLAECAPDRVSETSSIPSNPGA